MSNADNNQEPRLDRIEGKIDKLSDAMISLARSEEKIITLQETVINQSARLNTHSTRLDNVENSASDNEGTVKAINRVFWIAVTASLVTVFGKLIFGIEIISGF
jgi:hypothetical protein